MELNKDQKKIIETINGPVLCVAGPGSGKTSSVIRRVKNMINKGIAPESILMITFTREAANEMKNRFRLLDENSSNVKFGTIHSVCFEILKHNKNYSLQNVLSENEKYAFFGDVAKEIHIEYSERNNFVSSMINQISKIKNNNIDVDSYEPENCEKNAFKTAFLAYERFKKDQSKIDFDDMIILCNKLLKSDKDELKYWQNIYKYIIIDEFQDTNLIQSEIFYLLAKPENNICVIGDDDQSIYRFRGADPQIMLDFEKEFPFCKKINLTVNYRSETSIVEATAALISNNKNRFDKSLTANKKSIGEIALDGCEDKKSELEALSEKIKKCIDSGVLASEIAVLYRTNVESSFLVRKFIKDNIAFNIKENPLNIYNQFIFKDLIKFYHLSQKNGTVNEFTDIVNKPNKYLKYSLFFGLEEVSESAVNKCLYKIKETWKREKAQQNIRKLFFTLDYLSKAKDPADFIDKVIYDLDYITYLKEYAELVNADYAELRDIVDELRDSAKQYKTFEEWFEFIREYNTDFYKQIKSNDTEGITLSTMHGSKGLEWDVVFIINVNEKNIPHSKSKTDDDFEEERRLFYVACTRARKTLHIMYVKSKNEEKVLSSRFIGEMLKKPRKEETKEVKDIKEFKYVSHDFQVGEEVIHELFGRGVITSKQRGLLTIRFSDGSLKMFAESICKKQKNLTVA